MSRFVAIICLCGHLERASGTGFLTGPCHCVHVYVSMMHVNFMFQRLLSTSFASTVRRSFVALEGVINVSGEMLAAVSYPLLTPLPLSIHAMDQCGGETVICM